MRPRSVVAILAVMAVLLLSAAALAANGSKEERSTEGPRGHEAARHETAPFRSDEHGEGERDTQLRLLKAELATLRAQHEEARAQLADDRRERDEFAALMDRSNPDDRDMLAYLDAGVAASRADVASWDAMVRQQEAQIRLDERGKATSLRFEV